MQKLVLYQRSTIETVSCSVTSIQIAPTYTNTVNYSAPSGKTIIGVDRLVCTGSNYDYRYKEGCQQIANNGSSLTFTVGNFGTTTQTVNVSCNVLVE